MKQENISTKLKRQVTAVRAPVQNVPAQPKHEPQLGKEPIKEQARPAKPKTMKFGKACYPQNKNKPGREPIEVPAGFASAQIKQGERLEKLLRVLTAAVVETMPDKKKAAFLEKHGYVLDDGE